MEHKLLKIRSPDGRDIGWVSTRIVDRITHGNVQLHVEFVNRLGEIEVGVIEPDQRAHQLRLENLLA